MFKIRSSSLFALAILAISGCAPQLAGTSAATASRTSAQCPSEDLSQWQPDPSPAAMGMTFQASCLPNGQAQITFVTLAPQALVRTIPTPGFTTVQLTAVADITNAGVVAQLWQGGKLLAEQGSGGAIDVQANIDQEGPVRYVLLIRPQAAGKVLLKDVHIAVKKRG